MTSMIKMCRCFYEEERRLVKSNFAINLFSLNTVYLILHVVNHTSNLKSKSLKGKAMKSRHIDNSL